MATGNIVSGSQHQQQNLSADRLRDEADEMLDDPHHQLNFDESTANNNTTTNEENETTAADTESSESSQQQQQNGVSEFNNGGVDSSSFDSSQDAKWPSWNDSSGSSSGGGGGGSLAVVANHARSTGLMAPPNCRSGRDSTVDAMYMMMLKQQQELGRYFNGYSHTPAGYNRMRLGCTTADNVCSNMPPYPTTTATLRNPSNSFDFSSIGASLAEILQNNDYPPTPPARRINGSVPVRCSTMYRPLSSYCTDIVNNTTADFIGEALAAAAMSPLSDSSSLPPPTDSINFLENCNGSRRYLEECYSRKVFVGGLPPDIDEEEIIGHFHRFGPLIVDWPHKAESKSYFPPKGYAFLIYSDERSVQDLIEACVLEDQKLYMCVSSPSIKDKPVQIRPWLLSDSDYVMDGSQPLDPRKTIFVGGVPRPLRAVELALIMNRLYGGVCYAGIDTDPELKYPKGAGRVAFSNQQSYIAAISARFVQLRHTDIDKRVEVKPYVLDDQMCDECQGSRCNGKYAPFFCANVTCLQYYCENCWTTIHSRPGREFHKPLVKEGADRPRSIPYRWSSAPSNRIM